MVCDFQVLLGALVALVTTHLINRKAQLEIEIKIWHNVVIEIKIEPKFWEAFMKYENDIPNQIGSCEIMNLKLYASQPEHT